MDVAFSHWSASWLVLVGYLAVAAAHLVGPLQAAVRWRDRAAGRCHAGSNCGARACCSSLAC